MGVQVRGVVQGVGFRPFVYAEATRRGLAGWVRNRPDGVQLEVEGPEEGVRDFLHALQHHPPPAARVEALELTPLSVSGTAGFHILESEGGGRVRPTLPADLAACTECLAEVETPGERRHRYPFTNCTRCGPRYTVIEALPYDRARTSLRHFPLCGPCAAEYADVADRRFHAQPVACPACGPTLRWLHPDGREDGAGEAALQRAVEVLSRGGVLALQGLGGFQLLVDATSAEAVARLRRRKRREEKPFAVMFPSLEAVRAACRVSAEEARALASPEAPILLLRRGPSRGVVDGVAPGSPWLGAMLPYTPLHHLLLEEAARPLVCTSGNLTEEPMCTTPGEALERLGDLADGLLVHDRPIVRPVDDSVARVAPWGLQVLRRARGWAPLPHPFRVEGAPCLLALGGHLKGAIALHLDGQAVVSQHLGDLGSPQARLLLERTVDDLLRLLEARPAALACDAHPDYASTRLAERLAAAWGVPLERVQHHHAHVAAGLAEHALGGPVLGLAWDGAGLGSDGTLWGGEALVVEGATFRRVAHLRPFSLPGGERALREPRRAALGLLHEVLGEGAPGPVAQLFSPEEARVLVRALARGVQAPRTSSVGRLFDAVAALTGVRARAGFEGQAAMALEAAADGEDGEAPYPLPLLPGTPAVADWEPLVRALLSDRARGVSPGRMAARFHGALVALAEEVAVRVGLPRVVLSGGCFQNLRLARAVRERLLARGFEVFLPTRFPPNDGGLCLGQLWVAAHRRKEACDVPGHPG